MEGGLSSQTDFIVPKSKKSNYKSYTAVITEVKSLLSQDTNLLTGGMTVGG